MICHCNFWCNYSPHHLPLKSRYRFKIFLGQRKATWKYQLFVSRVPRYEKYLFIPSCEKKNIFSEIIVHSAYYFFLLLFVIIISLIMRMILRNKYSLAFRNYMRLEVEISIEARAWICRISFQDYSKMFMINISIMKYDRFWQCIEQIK